MAQNAARREARGRCSMSAIIPAPQAERPAPSCEQHPAGTIAFCGDCAAVRLETSRWALETPSTEDALAVSDLLRRQPQRACYTNPLGEGETRKYAKNLRRLLASLDREIVDLAITGYGQSDLLDAEGEEVNRVREFLDGRIFVPLESLDLRGRGLALLDAFVHELESSQHGHPSRDATIAPRSNATAEKTTAGAA